MSKSIIDGAASIIKPDEGQEYRKGLWKLIAIASVLALGACSSGQVQQAQTTINTASADVATATQIAQGAINAYPIAKGLLQVAAAADPALATTINNGIAFLDPKVQQIQALISAGSTDAAALTTLATTINQQVQSLTTTAAPAIKVVPSVNTVAAAG